MHWTVHLTGGPQRVNHAALAVGHLIYSFGGYICNEDLKNMEKMDICVLNTETLRWFPINYPDFRNVPFNCYGHTVVYYKGKVHLWGGRNNFRASNILYCYDVDKNCWSQPKVKGAIPGAADGHSACIIDHYMYIFGGFEEESEEYSQSVWRLDLEKMLWEYVETKGEPPSCRDFHSASVIGRNMYIFGGRSMEADEALSYPNKLCYLETDTMTWVHSCAKGDIPLGRRSHSAVVFEDEMYIFGGYNHLQHKHLCDLYKYNPKSNLWSSICCLGKAPSPRRRHCSVVVGEHLFVFGGTCPSPSQTCFGNDDGDDLIDQSDLHVLDFFPSLKRLSQLKIISCQLNMSSLPRCLAREIRSMTANHTITDDNWYRRDFSFLAISA